MLSVIRSRVLHRSVRCASGKCARSAERGYVPATASRRANTTSLRGTKKRMRPLQRRDDATDLSREHEIFGMLLISEDPRWRGWLDPRIASLRVKDHVDDRALERRGVRTMQVEVIRLVAEHAIPSA